MTRPKKSPLQAELIAIGRQARLMAESFRPRAKKARAHQHAPHVAVFLHGYMAAGAVFEPLRETVERECSLHTLDFSYGSHRSFEYVTERFDRFVQGQVPPAARLILIGHSLGGLVARWWLQEMGGAARTDLLLTMATPHAGTRHARLAFGPMGKILSPTSEVLHQLRHGRAQAEDVTHVAFVAGADRMIAPPSSAGAIEHATVTWFDAVGHNAMLYDEEVMARVVRTIRDVCR